MGMKSIEERAKEFVQNFEIVPQGMDCEDCDTCTKCNDYRRFVDIVTEQKLIDIDKACYIFCHTGCPHKTDSYNCLKDKCDTWKTFRRMMEE